MGAGVQRWWRDYEQECSEWTGTCPYAEFWIGSEVHNGINVKVRMYVMPAPYYGVITVPDDWDGGI